MIVAWHQLFIDAWCNCVFDIEMFIGLQDGGHTIVIHGLLCQEVSFVDLFSV